MVRKERHEGPMHRLVRYADENMWQSAGRNRWRSETIEFIESRATPKQPIAVEAANADKTRVVEYIREEGTRRAKTFWDTRSLTIAI